MAYNVPHYINGNSVTEDNTLSYPIHNPASAQMIGKVHFASTKLCDEAIRAAHHASQNWSTTPTSKRAKILFKFRDLLDKHQRDLALIVSREHGKTVEDALGSVARGIELVELHCGLINQLQGDVSIEVAQGIDCQTFRQPLGVCLGISPFNFPVMIPIWSMIPAIACGNTFILKPSEQTPSAPIRLLELLNDAGLPPGVVNCLHGNKETVDYLVSHPGIASVTAVASTPVARAIYHLAITNGKRAHTFGGAKNHCVLMPDADLKQAATAIVGAAYGSAGERCMAISVVVAVGDDTADQFVKEITPLIKAIRINAGDVPHTDMGPLVSAAHREKVLSSIDYGINEGAQLIIDGRHYTQSQYPEGYFLGPCLFDQVNENMSIYQNEIFGPVLVIVRVPHFEDALALVNKHQFGNGTAIFTRDGFTAREYSQRVQVGMVGINIPIPVPIANHPFGGWKHSSFGDISMHGTQSIAFYTKLKTITSKWPSHELQYNTFTMPTHN